MKLPYAYTAKDFINKYRTTLIGQTTKTEIPKPLIDTDGRSYITTYGEEMAVTKNDEKLYFFLVECLRKRARGDVTVKMPGTGIISVNGKGIDYFKDTQPREQVSYVLELILCNFKATMRMFL